jgi:hypothetical protein
MSCDEIRELVLGVATDAAARQRLVDALQHVLSCEECRAVFADFDQIADCLRTDQPAAAPEGGWEAFEKRLPHFSDRVAGHPSLRFWTGPTVSIAAGLVLAVGAFLLGQRSVSTSAVKQLAFTSIASSSQAFALDPSEVVHDTTAFAEASKAFDHQAGWVLVSNSTETLGSRGMGISAQPVDLNQAVDVLRLTMSRCGKTVSMVDLVIVPGQSADLTVALPDRKTVRYLAGTLANHDDRLNLRAEIRSTNGDPPVASLATTLPMQSNGQISAGELQTDSGRYELHSAFSRAAQTAK